MLGVLRLKGDLWRGVRYFTDLGRCAPIHLSHPEKHLTSEWSAKMKTTHNRRQTQDRRERELGPPKGWSERRKSVERRLPEVVEIPFSDWLACFPAEELDLRQAA